MTSSRSGRPRRLTDAQIAEILAWHDARLTNAQMAARYGISRGRMEAIIRTRGKGYKQPSPDRA